MKKRILFVDDEQNILDGLRRMLRSRRDEWDIVFASGAREALDMISREPVDVVVSDMRMPVMNGVEFLTEVMRRHPHIIRIILSGHADKELIKRSTGVAHQYLSKPCQAALLLETITKTAAVNETLADDRLKHLISQLGTLPSLPSACAQIVEELKSPEASIRRVSAIISRDPGMTAKILQVVNSAFFGIRRTITSPAEAATYLGLETIQSLVLSVQVFSAFDSTMVSRLSMETIWSHSLQTGRLAKRIAQLEDAPKQVTEAAFTAGLLHDVGILVLASCIPQSYEEVMARAEQQGASLCVVEREFLGASHEEVGAYLLGLWALPEDIVETAAFHHRPRIRPAAPFNVLTAVHAAAALNAEARGGRGAHTRPGLDMEYFGESFLMKRLETWRSDILAHAGTGGSA